MCPPIAMFPDLEKSAIAMGTGQYPGAVLLVEDDESLSDLLKHLLGRMQIRILHAATAEVALKTFLEHRASIALAFVDCHLPDSEGGELCRRLRLISPALPLLLTSGRDQRALAATLAAGGPCTFLAKPYMPADVMGRVNSMLVRDT